MNHQPNEKDNCRKTIYYDGSCDMCNRIIKKVDNSLQREKFNAIDITRESLPQSLTKEEAEKEIHVIGDDSKIYKNAEAILKILEEYPKWKFIVKVGRLPIIKQLLPFGYKIIASHRHALFRFHKTKNFLRIMSEDGRLFMLIRILFAVHLYFAYPFRVHFREQPYPIGLAQYFDLTFFGDPGVHLFLQVGTIVALVFYCAGRFMVVSLIFLLVATIGPVTLLNSQGNVTHTWQIFPLVLLGQLLAYSYGAISRFLRDGVPDRSKIHNMAIFFSQQMIVSAYVVAGISKLIKSHGEWPLNAQNLAISVIKTHAQSYYGEPQHGVLEAGEWISRLIIEHQEIFVVLLVFTVLTELLAFMAVSSRRLGFVIGIGLILMHEGISWIMRLDFRHNELIIFVFFILPFLIERLTSLRFLKKPRANGYAAIPQPTRGIASVLDRIPLKLTWCVIGLGLLVYEWYPFSAFPMYARLSPRDYHYYVTDENKDPVSTRLEFGIAGSAPKRMMRTRLRDQVKTLGVVDESQVGAQFLRYLLGIRVPKEVPQYNQLLLWNVQLSIRDGHVIRQERLVSSIPVR